jgi:hypothetical protein
MNNVPRTMSQSIKPRCMSAYDSAEPKVVYG